MTKDPQQVERKRHIGNDMVVLIFQEGLGTFNPDNLRSEFNHVFVLVQYEKGVNNKPSTYRIAIARKPGVVESEPKIPNPPVFTLNSYFRDFLLTKCMALSFSRSFFLSNSQPKELLKRLHSFLFLVINSERAAYFAKNFAIPIERTRLTLLNNLFKKVVPDKNENS
jgi:hypothetical protein